MLGKIRGEVRFKEPMSIHTSLRLGGTADIFIVPRDVEDVRRALAFADGEGLPVTVLGGGNGVVVQDRGVRGVVLRLGGCLERVDFRGEEALAGAGVRLSVLVREAAAQGLGGIERLVTVPATVGGALAMSARADGVRFADVASVVYFLHPDGTMGEAKLTSGVARERTCEVPPAGVIVGARLELHRRRESQIRREIARTLRRKRAEQPVAVACAGRVWQDPPGTSAARLIARAGLGGKRLNGVEVSAKDPSFIINRGRVRAADVLALMATVRERVAERFGVTLVPRIRVLGE